MKPYRQYVPTKWESRIDNAIRLVAPRYHHKRIVAREHTNYFRYLSAYSSSSRRNSSMLTTGETLRGSREKLQIMWNAIQLIENSGLCASLLWKIQMYICGTLKFQSLCGDRDIATEYEDYMRIKCGKGLDLTNRFGLRQMCMLDVRSMLLKGDIGTNVVRQDNDLFLQGIEADRIGDPTNFTVTNTYIRGLRLDDTGIVTAADVFYRDRLSGVFRFDQTIPFKDTKGLPRFLFLVNPISYDDYRGVSVFKSAIDNATYIDRMREYELQALMWAASQSGIYHTTSGTLPEALPFDRQASLLDESGNKIDTYQVRPNTVTAVGMGENVSMFQHDRPSPNVLGMVKDTIRDICVGVGVSFEFGWDMSGLNGPAVRGVSAQDARAFETWQALLTETKLDPVAGLLIGNAIVNEELPYHEKWNRWRWQFPAKSTIDAGRESNMNIEEIAAGLNTRARVCADDNLDSDEVVEQLAKETQQQIETAMEVADALSKQASDDGSPPIQWREVYAYMYPPRKGAAAAPGMGGVGGMPPSGPGETPGQTTDGTEIDGENGNGKNGANRVQKFYSADQERDDHGRFTDEGGSTGSLRDDTGGKPPKVGEPFLVYRLGKGNPLRNTNAGNAQGVANHLINVDDVEKPAFAGGSGDRVAVYKVTPHEPWGKYEVIVSKYAKSKKIGRIANESTVSYSFPEGGKFDHEKIAEVPLKVIRKHLKEIAGTDDFNMAGTLAGAQAIKKAFGHKFRYDPDMEAWYSPQQERDEQGKFTDEGKGAESSHYEPPARAGIRPGLDQRIIDYKTDRPLNKGKSKDVVPIGKFVPGMHYVAYSKTPFFSQLNTAQGTPNPKDVSVKDYTDARAELFKEQDKQKLPIKDLIATQPVVNQTKVEGPLNTKKAISVVHYNGKFYVVDGHHHLAAMAEGGHHHVKARVLELGQTGGSGVWDATFTGPATQSRKSLAKQLGADPDKYFHEQTPAVQKKISDHFIKLGEAKYRAALGMEGWYREDQARDDHGRFAEEGGAIAGAGLTIHDHERAMHEAKAKAAEAEAKYNEAKAARPQPTAFDRAIADYKPDRTLSDPTKTTPIDKLVPGVGYVPYSQTPFFNQINVLQGTMNPSVDDIPDYVAQREALFQTIPVTKITLDNVVATQEMVNTDRVNQIVNDRSTVGDKAPQVVLYQGKKYYVNGHHRLAADMIDHVNQVDAHVLDLDHPEPPEATNEEQVADYAKALREMPAYKSVIDRLDRLGSTDDEIEKWSYLQKVDKDGNLTPEALAHNQKIINGRWDEAAKSTGEHPDCVLLIGPPAAGKSKSLEKRHFPFKAITIGADDVRGPTKSGAPGIPEYRGWNAAATQFESKIITNEMHERAIRGRYNFVSDEVGGNIPKILAKAAQLKAAGYNVHVIHVGAPLHETVARSWKRFKEEGRFVEPNYQLNHADQNPIKAYKQLRDSGTVKSWENVDNEGFKGTIVEQGSIDDKTYWKDWKP